MAEPSSSAPECTLTEQLSLTTTASDKRETFARSEFIRRHAAGQCAWIVIVSMNCLFEQNNLRSFNAYQQVWQMWKANVMQSIQNAGNLSRYIAGINNQITTTNWQAWEQQQASYDRIGRRFNESFGA